MTNGGDEGVVVPRGFPGRTESTGGDTAAGEPSESLDEQIRRLEADLARLQERYRYARRSRYRRLAGALGLIGTGTMLAGLYLPHAQEVLFALGGTGLFAAVLLYFLVPEPVVPAATGEYVYTALAANQVAVIGELGLQGETVYVPRGPSADPAVSLFVPQSSDYVIPSAEELASFFVIADDGRRRGISLQPSASDLLGQFLSTTAGGLRTEPRPLVDQLRDGLRDTFGVVESTRSSVNSEAGQASIGIDGNAFGRTDRFDNPVTSFIAAGLALGLETPISVDVTPAEAGKYDHIVTCHWQPDSG